MNEQLVELTKEGLTGLRQLLSGKHLRPAQLALTIVIVASQAEAAVEILLDESGQSRWEVAHG